MLHCNFKLTNTLSNKEIISFCKNTPTIFILLSYRINPSCQTSLYRFIGDLPKTLPSIGIRPPSLPRAFKQRRYFFQREYRQGYRGVLREDLVFAWSETRYSPSGQDRSGQNRPAQARLGQDQGAAHVFHVRPLKKFASPRPLATSRRASTLVDGVLFFRWLAKLARTGSRITGHSISPRKTLRRPAPSRRPGPSLSGISKKEFHNVPLSADLYNRASAPRSPRPVAPLFAHGNHPQPGSTILTRSRSFPLTWINLVFPRPSLLGARVASIMSLTTTSRNITVSFFRSAFRYGWDVFHWKRERDR